MKLQSPQEFKNSLIESIDVNDPLLIKIRADSMKKEQAKKDSLKQVKDKNNQSIKDKIDSLIKQKASITIEMENDHDIELEGGNVADSYGKKLEDIDKKISKLRSTLNESLDNSSILKDVKEYAMLNLKSKTTSDDDYNILHFLRNTTFGFAFCNGSKSYTSTTLFNFKIKENNFIIKLPKNDIQSGNSYTFNDYKNAIDFGKTYYFSESPVSEEAYKQFKMGSSESHDYIKEELLKKEKELYQKYSK